MSTEGDSPPEAELDAIRHEEDPNASSGPRRLGTLPAGNDAESSASAGFQASGPGNDAEPSADGSARIPRFGAGNDADRIAILEAREKELVALAQRVQADFENHRRRSRDEVAAAAGRGKEALLRALLPSLDNLERALSHSDDAGLKAVSRQLQDAFAAQGIVVIFPLGEAFDARVHEAVATLPQEGVKSGIVLQVAEAGYLLDGRVLRPARVIVAE